MKKLEFILQTSLEEYRTLRAEIMLRIRLRQNITNYAVLIFTGLLTFFAVVLSERLNINISKDMQAIILLIVPWLFYPLALLYLRHDLFIAALAGCIEHKISPKINKLLNIGDNKHVKRRIWEWETYIHTLRKSLSQKILAGIRYIPLLLPSFISLVYSYFVLSQKLESVLLDKYKFNILVLNIVIFIVIVLFIIFRTLSIEQEITELK